jgi:Protein of unknown function, DUF488
MQTACCHAYFGPGRIAICRGARGVPAGYKVYRPLAPGKWFNSVDYPEYYRRYRRQLDMLDPERVLEELKALAAPHAPVLLCWEKPPLHADNWCHRSIVARWFWETLGLEVKERYHGKHKSWNWQKLPPFTTGRSWKGLGASPELAPRSRHSEARP